MREHFRAESKTEKSKNIFWEKITSNLFYYIKLSNNFAWMQSAGDGTQTWSLLSRHKITCQYIDQFSQHEQHVWISTRRIPRSTMLGFSTFETKDWTAVSWKKQQFQKHVALNSQHEKCLAFFLPTSFLSHIWPS